MLSTLLTRALLLCALCNKALLQKRSPSNPPLRDPLPTFTAPFIPMAHCTSHSPAQPRLPFCAASEPLTQRALHPKPQHPSKPAPLPHPAQHHKTQQPMQCAGGPRLTETGSCRCPDNSQPALPAGPGLVQKSPQLHRQPQLVHTLLSTRRRWCVCVPVPGIPMHIQTDKPGHTKVAA
jgi:hypothetical protein